MPIKFEVRDRHLHAHWSGTITANDLAAMFKELPAVAAGCKFVPHILHTMDPKTELQLGTLDACEYSVRRARTPIPTRVKAAFVANTPVAVAIASSFRGLNGNPNLTMQAFPSEAEALSWLGVGEAPGAEAAAG